MDGVSDRTLGAAGEVAAMKPGVVASGGVCFGAGVAAVILLRWWSVVSSAGWGEVQYVLALIAMCVVPLGALHLLRRRDNRFPFFDVGAICVMVTTLYFVVPLLNFIFGGMAFTVLSDNRLFTYSPSPGDLAPLIWGAVLYLLAFCAVYVMLRGKGYPHTVGIDAPGGARIGIMILLGVGLGVSILGIEMSYEVSVTPSYEDLRAGIGSVTQLPYYLQQVVHNLQGMYLVAKQALLLVIVFYWKKRSIRTLGLAWLLAEIIWSVARQGARTDVVLLILSAALLYHRLVRPLSFSRICIGGLALLSGVFLVGVVRDLGLSLSEMRGAGVSVLSITNEFQSLFGTAYDLHERSARGGLSAIPWTVYLSEVFQLAPSQILPFRKMDPADWYLELLGLRESGVGFMFGVLSQGVVGGGPIELLARGMLLGGVYAAVHRWYVRRSSTWSATLTYLFVCVWSYYTVRATTFYFVYFAVYRLAPFLFLTGVGGRVLSAVTPARRSP
jgi:hypothetical protein